MNNPTPEEIKQSRTDAGLTQSQAAALIHCGLRTWQHWENGDREMHPAFWELFTIKSKTIVPVFKYNGSFELIKP